MNTPQTSSDGKSIENGLTATIERSADEIVVIRELLDLDDKDILDLGCGRGDRTRAIAGEGTNRRIVGLEVDSIQHAINLKVEDLPNVRFESGGAEAIPAADCSFDAVFMFKSLHHVPVESMPRALAEIARVLRPGGLAYISEPLFRGSFNEVLQIFHDESVVRQAAFEAIVDASRIGILEMVSQTFFHSPLSFASFEEFEQLVIGATHSDHSLSSEVLERVRTAFAKFEATQGTRFEQPIRVDLLRRSIG